MNRPGHFSSNLQNPRTSDAQGNVMAVYTYKPQEAVVLGDTVMVDSYRLTERHIYGSSRVGMDTTPVEMIDHTGDVNEGERARNPDQKTYELSNHLGNVLATFTSRRLPVTLDENTTVSSYVANVRSVQDYYPFGMHMPGRSFVSGEGHRYGFQGQEKDDEVKGDGNSVNFKYRMHDPRLGRFFSVDPLTHHFPWNSPFAFSENSPIAFVELEGLEKVYFGYTTTNGYKSRTAIDFSHLTEKEITAKLNETKNYHQGHLSAQDIKSMRSEEVMTVTDHLDSYADSFGTSIKKYASDASYNSGKGVPYESEMKKGFIQELTSWDTKLQGRDGMVAAMPLMLATAGVIFSGGSLWVASSAAGGFTSLGTATAVRMSLGLAISFDGLTTNVDGNTFLDKIADSIAGETGVTTLKSLKLIFNVADMQKGLVGVLAKTADGKSIATQYDVFNQVLIETSVFQGSMELSQKAIADQD